MVFIIFHICYICLNVPCVRSAFFDLQINFIMGRISGAEMQSANMITAGTTITGDVSATGDIRIEGVLLGNLVTKGKLVIGATGQITGDIACNNSDIEGFVEGKITVTELLSLKSTSKMIGDVITNKLAIEPGAIFSGTCSMKDTRESVAEKKK